ncbi:class I SAM-dependent methyltransferase, partial [Ventosimonas gracilis]
GYLLELLWAMDLLERETTPALRYRNQPVANGYLNAQSENYCGDALLFRHRIVRQVGAQLGELVRHDTSALMPDRAKLQRGWAQAARVQIAQEQRAVTADVARELCARLGQFQHARRLLDLGGGPGLVAIALAQIQSALTGVVFEYPQAAAVAQEHIDNAGLSSRLQAIGGDLNSDDFGTNYDLVWCSSVLHFVADIPAVLQRLYRAMRPGGVLVCCHAEVLDDAACAKRILQYYLHMRMQGRQVWPQGELAQALAHAGWINVQTLQQVRFPVTPLTVLIAHKPRANP